MINYSDGFLFGWKAYRVLHHVNIYKQRYLINFTQRKIRKEALRQFPSRDIFVKKLMTVFGMISRYDKNITDSQKGVLIRAADTIVDGYYDILGSGQVLLKPFDWHTDFKSGKRWPPGLFYKDYDQVDLNDNSDVKVPRELSRGHHLLILGQAYLITGEERYANQVTGQISNWIDENPYMRSINWGCAMEVAIRAVNWLYAIWMIGKSPKVTDVFINQVVPSLLEHSCFIFTNLEKSFKNSNNHYMSDLAGLIFLGNIFSESKSARMWNRYAINEFFTQIRYQILPTGVSYELSISYHRLMVELVFYTYLFLVRNQYYIPLDIKYRIRKMFDFVLNYAMPNGLAPIVGDQDDGRFLPFGIQDKLDHRYLLSLAAEHFQDEVFEQFSSGGEAESFFLLPIRFEHKNFHQNESRVSLDSKCYEDAGFCVLRNEDFYVFISNSGAATYPDQVSKWGSHSHADMLSFVLNYKGMDFVVDPGTYAYSSDPIMRNKFRNSSMHNTIIVDGVEQQSYPEANIFRTVKTSKPLHISLRRSTTTDICTVSHDGYQDLSDPVDITRTFILDSKEMAMSFSDKVSCKSKHEYTWFFHLDHNVQVSYGNSENTLRLVKNNRVLLLNLMLPSEYLLRIDDGFVSKSFGTKVHAKIVSVTMSRIGAFEAKFVFTPNNLNVL